MSQEDVWSVARLLTWTTQYLGEHDSESPRLDAEILLAESLDCKRIELYTTYDSVPNDKQRTAFRELVRRRAEGMPVAYLVGHREFYSLSFRVSPDVLIPRPETEFVVVALLDLVKQTPCIDNPVLCDMGTGSGILAVCAAKQIPTSRITAVDISEAALEIARHNAVAHGVERQIEFLKSDLFTVVPPERRFHYIVSNPPYVNREEMETLAPEVRNYEPHLALLAGERGTEIIEPMIDQAANRLEPGGFLLVEISPMLHDTVFGLLEADSRLQPLETVKDLAQLPRVVRARRKPESTASPT